MRRVLIIGSGGAGKSTLARRLGERTSLPVIHLDRLYWRPGWVATPAAEWRAVVESLVSRDAWIMDGNYGGTLGVRLAACDTVVFLDLPRIACIAGVLGRWLRFRGRSRDDLTDGCPERMTWEFVRWVWTYPARRRPEILRMLRAVAGEKRVVILGSRGEITRFLAGALR